MEFEVEEGYLCLILLDRLAEKGKGKGNAQEKMLLGIDWEKGLEWGRVISQKVGLEAGRLEFGSGRIWSLREEGLVCSQSIVG